VLPEVRRLRGPSDRPYSWDEFQPGNGELEFGYGIRQPDAIYRVPLMRDPDGAKTLVPKLRDLSQDSAERRVGLHGAPRGVNNSPTMILAIDGRTKCRRITKFTAAISACWE
jgi:hypothetical protein